ncbi:MAG: glycyl-radical enzyme activating protein [Prolixibacteraceae bacterium]|nr:glycyl-radical enzyme activating protein [Prolixibacteraceae bacterium]
MIGRITTIQRMSLHDGPGIRSTVFLKGCNMHCGWCHNPETLSMNPELEWIQQKCIGCNSCTEVCPTGAFSLKDGKPDFQKNLCTSCFDCLQVCYAEAINKIGREVTPEDVFTEVEQDFPFFSNSGGGVTISGGEPMLQPEFTKQTLALFKKAGIHTALDTNLSISWKQYEKVLPFTDLVLADLKMMDNALHQKWTGRHNTTILENIYKLDASGVPYFIRTPVVPDINDNEAEISAMAAFVASLKNVKNYELLPFHTLASCKYTNLKLKNPMGQTQDLSKERLERFQEIVKYTINHREKGGQTEDTE